MSTKKQRTVKTPSLGLSLIPLLGLVLFLGIGYGKFRFPTQVCMLAAAAVAAIVAYACGLSWDEMFEGVREKISASLPSIFVMICVGAMISSWMISGTIPMMIYYGIKIIDPRWLFVTGFIVCAIISTVTGTSFGSAGTAGIAVMGVAIAVGAPLPIAAGAVISGAVFGDKLSPFSDTTILAPIAGGCDLYDHIKHMFFTTGCASIVALIVYAIAGLSLDMNSMATAETVDAMLTSLEGMYHFNILLLLPVVIVLGGAFLKKPTVPCMLLASLVALILGVAMQGFTVSNAATAFYSGFNVSMVPGVDLETVPSTINTLLNRGGLMGMMSTILLIFCAIGFGGIYSKTGCINVILNKMLSAIKSVGGLITSTVVATIFMSIVTGSSYLAILVPGELFKGAFDEFKLHGKNLSRTLEDAGTCVVPLVPWAVAGTYMANTLGVPTLEYLPWAVLCYTSFIFAIIFGYTGITIRDKDDQPIRKKKEKVKA
ncbi:MAG: Na+/H+ antiporter NhaC [Oscillospiraceae bacterium]|jgi:NhaC family Na+:H+ antiporter|nr:Na+/H+ antiporter NhaC [Oscillospiraceae bacterium]